MGSDAASDPDLDPMQRSSADSEQPIGEAGEKREGGVALRAVADLEDGREGDGGTISDGKSDHYAMGAGDINQAGVGYRIRK